VGNNGKVAEILALARLQGQLSWPRDRDRDAPAGLVLPARPWRLRHSAACLLASCLARAASRKQAGACDHRDGTRAFCRLLEL